MLYTVHDEENYSIEITEYLEIFCLEEEIQELKKIIDKANTQTRQKSQHKIE